MMKRMMANDEAKVAPSGQSYDSASLEAVANEDPTPAIDL